MAKRAAGGKSDPPTWNPGKFALWSQSWPDPKDDHPTAVLLRHPTAPFTRDVEWNDDEEMQQELQKVAFAYLQRASSLSEIDPPLKLPQEWLAALGPGVNEPGFGWLPIEWPPEDFSDPTSSNPHVSFHADRTSSDGIDRTTILLASQRLAGVALKSGSDLAVFLGSGFGVRVVAHVQPIDGRKHKIRITGMSASLPFGRYKGVWKDPNTSSSLLALFQRFEGQIKTQIENTLGLKHVAFRGIRVGQDDDGKWQIKIRGTGLAKTTANSGKAAPYVFVYLVTLADLVAPDIRGVPVIKEPLVADAEPGHRRLFPGDPASRGVPEGLRLRRPTRSQEQLDECCEAEDLADGATKELRQFPLQYPRANGEKMKVVFCPGFVRDDKDGDRDAPKITDLSGRGPDAAIRSNDFTAVSAFNHVKQFFERLEAYGIAAEAYFRLAALPLKVAYRSGVRPGRGKDGQTVNARVLPEHQPVNVAFPEKAERPGLEMHLSLANLSHRARNPSGSRPSAVEPLGIATDVRWIWHEIGHVLLMAAVGELEFRFAHSPGDALAAIVADPHSKLALDANWRGATFPWVFIPRRHDRSVLQGWSWGGSLHRGVSNTRRKGYWTEQILSSSLFRLYQCLGGDTLSPIDMTTKTEKDLEEKELRPIRESASHYSVFLIMRGLQLLGSAGIVPTDQPDQFVSALIDADIGTSQWDVTFPPGSPTKLHRIGGCAHKVIRWAFEAQGMYAPREKITNAPGLPPLVDIYIADGRPSVSATRYGDVDYGPGNYVPVSLHWDSNQGESNVAPPLWQASATAIDVRGNDIYVTVRNRGSQPAVDVKVQVWSHEWLKDKAPPKWHNGKGWTQCDPPISTGKTIVPGGSETIGPFSHVPPKKRYLVLAQATCGDDPANTDPATFLPCSYLKTPLVDLVAGDNNLGLRVIKNP